MGNSESYLSLNTEVIDKGNYYVIWLSESTLLQYHIFFRMTLLKISLMEILSGKQSIYSKLNV